MSPDLIYLLVIVVPSALFILIFGLGLIFGIARGFRKSVILGIQAIVAFLIVIILFVIFILTDPEGKRLISVTNTFMGEGGLQKTLAQTFNVTLDTSKTTMKDVLMELLPKVMFKDNAQEAYRQLVIYNGEYIMTFVNFIIRFAYAFIAAVLYLLLVLIFYIIYLICYPERRHKRKIERRYESLESDKPYKKRRLLGMLIGGLRGLTSSLLIFSFLGSLLFIIFGTNGNKKYEKTEFSNEKFEKYYNIYNAIGSYGADGIFKVLGSIKNKDNIPYYLYLTEWFYSGTLNDPERGINNQNVWMVEELGTYSKFLDDTRYLLLEYGYDEFDVIMNDSFSQVTNKEHIDALAKVFKNQEFQTKFDKLIDDFESKTYLHNFALSLVDSIALHIDELTAKSDPMTKDILCIMFKKGYYCEEIGENASGNYPYLVASDLLSKQDAKNLLKAVLPIAISNVGSLMGDGPKTKVILSILRESMPEFKKLSILTDPERKSNVNGVFERLYLYSDKKLADKLSNNTQNGTQTRLLKASEGSNIDWVSELQTILDVGLDFVSIADNIIPADESSDFKLIDSLLYMFNVELYDDETNTRISAENKTLFKDAKEKMANSKLASLALTTTYVQNMITKAFSDIAPNLYLPTNLNYNDEKDGEVVTHGEIYNLLDGLEFALDKKTNVERLKALIEGDASPKELLSVIAELARKDETDTSILDKLLGATLLRSVLSSVLININNKGALGEFELYFPSKVFETDADGNIVKLITADELYELSDNLTNLVESVKRFIDETSEDYKNPSVFIDSEYITEFLESSILEGTISSVLKTTLASKEIFVIPDDLSDVDSWLSTEDASGETANLIFGIKNSHFDIKSILNSSGDIKTKTLDSISSMSKQEFEFLVDSRIIKYTVSDVIANLEIDTFELYIPSSALELTDDTVDGKKFAVINTNDMYGLTKEAKNFAEKTKTAEIIKSVVVRKNEVFSNNILLASFVSFVANNKNMKKSFIIPGDLKALATDDELDKIDYKTSPWKAELIGFFDSINEMIDLDSNPEFDDTLEDSIVDEIKNLNMDSKQYENKSRLDVCYTSSIMKGTFADKVDNSFKNTVSDKKVLVSIKYYETSHNDDNDYLFVKEIEFKALIDSLNVLKLDLSEEINDDEVTSSITTLNDIYRGSETKLDVIYVSSIIRDIFKQKLDKKLTASLIAKALRDTTFIKEEINENYVYKKNEVAGLIDTLNEFEVEDLNDFDDDIVKSKVLSLNNQSKLQQGKTSLDVLYGLDSLPNNLVREILYNKLEDALDDLLSKDGAILGSENVVYSDMSDAIGINLLMYFVKLEVSNLLTSLSELGITNLDDVEDVDYTSKFKSLDLDKTYVSLLMKDILTNKISDSLVGNSFVVDHEKSKESIDTLVDVYTKVELDSLQSFLNHLTGVDKLDELDASKVKLNNTTIPDILGSYILMGSVSKNVVDNDSFTVPASTYLVADELFEKNELGYLLYAIATFGEDSLDGFDADKLTPNSLTDLDVIVVSTVMRANITKNVKNGTKEVYVKDDEALVAKDKLVSNNKEEKTIAVTNTDIVILTSVEVVNLVDAFNIINEGGDDTFDASGITFTKIRALNVAKQKGLFKSNVMLNIIGDIIDGTDYALLRAKDATLNIIDSEDPAHPINYAYADSDDITYKYKLNVKKDAELIKLKDAAKEHRNVYTGNDILAFLYVTKYKDEGTDYIFA